jgi:hypothetical protein
VNEVQQKVLGLIDRKELIELALALGNIPSAAGEEAEIGNFIYDWLARNEYSPRRIGFVPERCCMAGVLPGTGESALRSIATWIPPIRSTTSCSSCRSQAAEPLAAAPWHFGQCRLRQEL